MNGSASRAIVAVVGITDYAQSQLGDVVYVELPEIGRRVEKGKEAAVVESVKAASEVYAPVSGEVVEVNEAIAADPAKVNADPMGEGWFFKLRLADPKELDGLMDEAAYQALCRGAALMRYLPLTEPTARTCWRRSASDSIDALFADVPRSGAPRGPARSADGDGRDRGRARALARWRRRNVAAGSVPFFLGGGAYRHHIPAAVDHLIQRGEFLTSYTPYQPEIAQGTLQYLFEFQTQVALLTGMEVANASLYDGATACAEAVMMASRVTGRNKAVLSGGLHPHYREVCETYARFVGFELAARRSGTRRRRGSRAADRPRHRLRRRAEPRFLRRDPRLFRARADLPRCRRAAGRRGHRDPLARAPFARPARWAPTSSPPRASRSATRSISADPMSGCSPRRDKFVRQMPGRLVGETVDAEGRRGWVLTLSTREQHIRREKATSNICTNSGLCALAFTIHLALLGEAGLTRLARLNHAAAVALAERLERCPGSSS